MNQADLEAELALSREAARRNGDSGLRVALLKQVEPLAAGFCDRWPTSSELMEVSETFGVEAASLMLEEISKRLAPNSLFVEELFRQLPLAFRKSTSRIGATNLAVNSTGALPLKAEPTAITAQPFASNSATEICFVESNDFAAVRSAEWGGHVETWRAWVRELGFTTDRIQTRAEASLFENAQLIRQHLRESSHSNRILVSVGRGSQEVLIALSEFYRDAGSTERDSEDVVAQISRRRDEELWGVRAWVNVAGAVQRINSNSEVKGSSVQASSGSARPQYLNQFLSLVSKLRLSEFSFLNARSGGVSQSGRVELSHQEFARIGSRITVASVVGLASLGSVPLGAKRKFLDRAERVGPNDGVYGFNESVVPYGYVVPVAGLSHHALLTGDHYVKPWLLGVLRCLESPGESELSAGAM